MPTNAVPILLAADGSPQADAAASLLADLHADLRRTPGSTVSVLGVVPQRWSLIGIGLKTRADLHATVARLRRVNHASARVVADRAAASLQAAGLTAAVTVREGAPAPAILGLAAELSAGLVALGARGFSPGPPQRLGPTARYVVRNAACSVLVARPRRSVGPLRLLLAVDQFTDPAAVRDSLRTLAPAIGAAAPAVLVASLAGWPARLELSAADLLARQSLEEEVALRALELAEHIQDLGFPVRNVFPTGAPRAELIRLAQASAADLVIVAPGRAAPGLGELAWAALKYAPCSVLVARPLPSLPAAPTEPASLVHQPSSLSLA